MVAYWNEVAGPRWVRLHEHLDAQLAEIGRRVLESAALTGGERVLDVGCGGGTLTLAAARAVGGSGRACGIDVSEPMLAHARQARERAAADNVELVLGDAQSHALDASAFDALISRFGVMFFEDPVAAFSNLLRALRPGGRAAFVCWQRPDANPWAHVPLGVVARHLTLENRPDPEAPGPFAFAAAERVERVLETAGFVDVRVEPLVDRLPVGRGLDAAGAAWLLCELGPAGAALRDADPGLRPIVEAELFELLREHETGGVVHLPYAAWRVTARKS